MRLGEKRSLLVPIIQEKGTPLNNPTVRKKITSKKIDKKLEGSNQTIKKMVSIVQDYGEFPLSPLHISLGFQCLPHE